MVKLAAQGLLAAWCVGKASCARVQVHEQAVASASSSETYCADSDGMAGYHFSHPGAWDDFVNEGPCADVHCCADKCSNEQECVAFAHSASNRNCYTFRGSLGATTYWRPNSDHVSSFRAYWRCGARGEAGDDRLFIAGPPSGVAGHAGRDEPDTISYIDMQVPSLEHAERWEAALRAVSRQGAVDVSVEVDLAVRFAALAYGQNSDVPVLATRVGPSVLQVEIHGTEDFAEGAHVVVFLYRLSQGGVGVVLSYKGSTGDSDWATNFQMLSVRTGGLTFNVPLFSEDTGVPEDLDQLEEDATVHPGFLDYKGTLDEAMRTWDMQSISQILFEEWGAPEAPDFLSWLRAGHWSWCIATGHSLGGGMSTVASVDLAVRTRRPVLLASVAAPVSGNRAFVATQNAKVVPHGGVRIFNRGDWVPVVGSVEGMVAGNEMHGGRPMMLQGSIAPLAAHIEYTIPSNVSGEVLWHLFVFPGLSYTPPAHQHTDHFLDAAAGSTLSPPYIPPTVLYGSDVSTPSVTEADRWQQDVRNAHPQSPEEEMSAVDVSVRYAMLSFSRNDGLPVRVTRLSDDVVEVQFHGDALSFSEGPHVVTYIYRLPEGGAAVVLSFKGLTGSEGVAASLSGKLLSTDSAINANGTRLFSDSSVLHDRLASSPSLFDIVRNAKVHPQFAQNKAELDQRMRAWDMLSLAPVLRDWGVSSAEPNFLSWLQAGHWRWCAVVGKGEGGAVAAITAVELGVLTGQKPVLATLGAPTAGNSAFASAQGEFASHGGGLRIFNSWDIVPNMGSDVSRRHVGHVTELPGQLMDRSPLAALNRYTVLSNVSGQPSWVTFAFPSLMYSPSSRAMPMEGDTDLFVSSTGDRSDSPPMVTLPNGFGYRDCPIPSPREVEAWQATLVRDPLVGEMDVTAHVDTALRFALLAQGRNSGDRTRITEMTSRGALSSDAVELQFHGTRDYRTGAHLVVYLYKLEAGGVGAVLTFKELTGYQGYTAGVSEVFGEEQLDGEGIPLLSEGQVPHGNLPPNVVEEVRQARLRPDLATAKAALDGSVLSWDMSSLAPLLESWGTEAAPNLHAWLQAGHWSWCIFVGHGIGGSIAATAATELGVLTGRKPLLATVGSPAAGNSAFERALSRSVGPSAGGLKISNTWDLIPHSGEGGHRVPLAGHVFDSEPYAAHTRFTVPSTLADYPDFANLEWARFRFQKNLFGYTPDSAEEGGTGLFVNFPVVTEGSSSSFERVFR